MLVKIDRSTIKRNPRAGSTSSMLQGNITGKFSCNHPIPENLMHLIEVTTENIDGTCSGFIINPQDFEPLLAVEGMSIDIDQGMQRIEHRPEPKYYYTYENPAIKCDECSKEVKLSEINTDYDDEGNEFTVCPACKSIESFGEIEYESIEGAIRNIDIKK